MIVDKEEFKKLKKEAGGLASPHIIITATHELGLYGVKNNSIGNLSIMNNGLYYDVILGAKSFIAIENIINADIEDNKLIIESNLDNEKHIIFTSNIIKDLVKVQNLLAVKLNIKAISTSELSKRQYVGINKINQQSIKTTSKRQLEKQRVKELKEEHTPYCPKCHSTSLQYVEQRKKLSIGRAVVGGTLAGPAGAVLGGLTSKKYKGKVKCLNCGHEWKL